VQCNDASDCGASSDCVTAICQSGVCAHPNVAQGSPCNGGFCDGNGTCVGCLNDSQCPSNMICSGGICQNKIPCSNNAQCPPSHLCAGGFCQ
jgi:hypothetical protein